VHEKNSSAARRHHNAWTQKSSRACGNDAWPVRKAEISGGYLDSIDQYSYQAPAQAALEGALTELSSN
jgi:hypothetical protein